MSAQSHLAELPGTDEFIKRCERVRAWNYVVRAAAQARLAPPVESAGTATFGDARVWFTGTRARVHLLTETSLDQLPAIEFWLQERKLVALFDVLPIVECRPIARALSDRGYHLVAWQPMLYRALSVAMDEHPEAMEVRELDGESSEFRAAFLAGYEVPARELANAERLFEERWRSEGARRFVAHINGQPVAAATLVIFDGIARLANCATVPRARNLGAQSALVRARLRCALTLGLKLAISDARQGGGSIRNLARAGFGICAHITQWQRSVNATCDRPSRPLLEQKAM